MTVSALGWLATAGFAGSYLTKRAATLKAVQASAAGLWVIYGTAIGAPPIVVANVIVACAALYSLVRRAPGTSD